MHIGVEVVGKPWKPQQRRQRASNTQAAHSNRTQAARRQRAGAAQADSATHAGRSCVHRVGRLRGECWQIVWAVGWQFCVDSCWQVVGRLLADCVGLCGEIFSSKCFCQKTLQSPSKLMLIVFLLWKNQPRPISVWCARYVSSYAMTHCYTQGWWRFALLFANRQNTARPAKESEASRGKKGG